MKIECALRIRLGAHTLDLITYYSHYLLLLELVSIVCMYIAFFSIAGHRGMFFSFMDPIYASRRYSWYESEMICNFHGMTLASLQDELKHFKVARLMGILSECLMAIVKHF